MKTSTFKKIACFRRRALSVLTVLCALATSACEDGPYQTFSAAPTGAQKRWNDGTPPANANPPASQGFASDFAGGGNKQEICTGEERAKRWAAMVHEPIIPPTQAAGLDGAGGAAWQGLTVEQAEKINCQSTSLGDYYGDGTLVNLWGDNGEVLINYSLSNHNKIVGISLSTGYLGALNFKSRDGKNNFQIVLNTQITKNGNPYQVDWDDDAKFNIEATEIADALLATYAPQLPAENIKAGSCIANGHCTKALYPDQAALRVWPLGVHLSADYPYSAQPIPSKFTGIDLSMPRVMPYSLAATQMKLDKQGPLAQIGGLGGGAKTCKIELGMTWKEFLANCVNVTGKKELDDVAYAKLTGNIGHGAESFLFDTSGIDVNFLSSTLAPFEVLLDADRPQDGDKADSVSIDAESLGVFTNDYANDGKTQDLHGTGAIYFEYARLVQAEINRQIKLKNPAAVTHELGDPACLFPDSANFDPATFKYAENCTGFEGFLTPLAPLTDKAGVAMPVDVSPTNRLRLGVDAAEIIGALGMKPGKPLAAFCMDANGNFDTGYFYCGTGDKYGAKGAFWDVSYQRVLSVLGKGQLTNLPLECRDRRFYFRMYATAVVKYLTVAADPLVVDLSAVDIDLNNLIFDTEGSGQSESAEFIDRRFVSGTQAPLDFVIAADIVNGTLYNYSFARYLVREEAAMYQAMTEKSGTPLGKENGLSLTNVFGSPVLANGWTDHEVKGAAKKSAYQCATADWKTKDEYTKIYSACEGELPPLDPTYATDPTDPTAPPAMPLRENGKPYLTPYKGAFAGSETPFSLGSARIDVEATLPALASAKVKIHRTSDPYDPESSALAPIAVLVPWLPPQPGSGYFVPTNAQQDKLIEAGLIDFSGVTTSFSVYYHQVEQTDGGLGPVQIAAVEAKTFLGDVFLCQDPQSRDILRTRMYGSVQAIIEWIDAHPGVYDACGLLIRYSPYDNFPDFILSTVNGVRIGVSQGGGYGRVNDATLSYVETN